MGHRDWTRQRTYMSIRETAKLTGLGESFVRKGVKNKTVPGFYVAGEGSKFMVNVPMLLKQLEKMSVESIEEREKTRKY